MSQVKQASLAPLALFSLWALLLTGCGDTPPEATFNTGTGQHAAGWLPGGHKEQAKAHMETCADCHGADFLGGIAKVACTQCHLGNQNSVHPVQWGNFAYALHGNYARLNGTASCANATCHGPDLTGVPGSGPSCTQCHLGGPTSIHPSSWQGDPVVHGGFALSRGTASCANAVCHGPDLKGIFLSGPSCNTCHPF